MPIIDHNKILEVPWRPGYRKWDIVESNTGMNTNLSYSIADVGTGAPLHLHEDDEVIVVIEGQLEVQIGEEKQIVGPDHTIAIPPSIKHGFKVVGSRPARLMVFFPVINPFERTTYIEGENPALTEKVD